MIRLEQVVLQRENRTILHGIDLHMRSGEHWVILGRNGSGKTTLLEMINGYLFPSSGSVSVLGNRYGSCDLREVRRRIGYVSQSLMDKLALRDPVWEAVATGEYGYLRFYEQIPQELQDKAEAMLERVKLGRVKDQPIVTLSQGERKKMMLARALMNDPAILVLDEPCSGLDLYEREALLADIQELGASVGLIYVTHHLEEMIPVFTHVALLEEGSLIAAGKKREVLTPERLQQVFHLQVELDWTGDRPWARVFPR